jgi:PAS domain S-box-containing protein/diguanylate cyclase (GGDEF)-like protein
VARREASTGRRGALAPEAVRVLLVEDAVADVELELRELKRAGLKLEHRVVKAEAEFRAALAEFHPEVILSDFSMPGFDGMRALQLARELSPDTPFVFVSGTLGEEYAIRALRRGAIDYVLKSNLARLPVAVERAVQEARERAAKREAERARRESETGLRRAQSMAGLAHVVTRADGSFESWSETLPKLAGLAPAEMPKSTREWLDLVHPEDRAQFRATAIEAGRRGTRMDVEYRLRRGDGAWIHIRQASEPIEGWSDAEGRMRWFGTLLDVSAQKQAARSLQSSVELYRATFEQANVGIVHTSLEGDVLMVNQALCAITGYSRIEAIQLHIRDLTHPEDIAQSVEGRAKMLSGTGTPYQRELRLRRKDGAHVWASVTSALVRGAEGKPRHFVSVIQDISERKRMEQSLRDAEERYRSIFENAIEGIFQSTPEGKLIDCNPANARFLGYDSPQELLAAVTDAGTQLYVNPADRRRLLELVDKNGFVHGFEAEMRCKDGRTVWSSLSVRAVRNASGAISHMLGMQQDVTARVVAEREAKRFRSAMDVTVDSIYLIDPATMRFLYVNDTACRRLGYTRDELMRKTSYGLVGKTRAQIEREYDEVVAAGEQGARSESEFVRSDGSRGWTELHRRALRLGGDSLIVTVGRDITERRQAEAKLRESEHNYRNLFETNPQPMWFYDPTTLRFVAVNDAAVTHYGYSRDEFLSMTIADIRPREEVPRLLGSGALDVRGGVTQSGLWKHRKKDGTIIDAEVTSHVSEFAGRRLKVVLAHDVTERKRAEIQIRRLNRIYAVLSGINSTIVRVCDRDALLRDACRIAFEAGGFPIVWAGILDREKMEVQPVAWRGVDEDYVRTLRRSISKVAPGEGGVVGLAVRSREPVVSNDIARDARLTHGARAADRGSRALIVLPLLVAGEAAGVLALHAREAGFFDEEEMRLLRELAGDVSFALENIAKTEKLNYLALYDPLTGLPNRTLLVERLGQSIHDAGQAGAKFAVACFDLERLTTINDSLGRQVGDQVIKQVAERVARAAGIAARITADQFVAVLPTAKGRSEAGRMGANLARACFAEPYRVEEHELKLAAKAGLALFPNDGVDAETLLANAEAALRKAKDTGERQLFYTPDLTERTGATLTLENKLRRALENDEFVLHYQPKVDTETRRILGVEALIRWQSPELGLVPPMKFIPLMEETGMILDVGAWALKRAALDHRRWTEQGLKPPRVAVNVSAIQLRQRDFVRAVEQAILDGVAPTGIDLEITESLIMEDIEANIGKLKEARALGVGIAIDDFGTGYSSLSYLAKLPVQMLKIDRSFVITMLSEPDTMTLVQTIISLAHSLRLKVVAEGVDAEEQAKVLRLLRCDELQGYLISKPVPREELATLLEQKAAGYAGSR